MTGIASNSLILKVLRITSGTLSNADGYELLLALRNALATQATTVTLDLTDVVAFSSSFLNSSIGALYEELGASSYQRLRLSNYKPAQLNQLKEYMADVARTHKAG